MSHRFSIAIAGAAMALFLAAVAFRSFATARGIPVLAGDSCVFLPQAIRFHERGELINAVWRPAAQLDVLGKGRMIYHGFLYPMLLSLFLWRSDYPSVASVLGILYGADTLLFGVLFWSFAKRWKWPLTPRRLLLILVLTMACAAYIQGGVVGRPEPLAALVLLGGVLWMERASPLWRGRIAGIGIGVLGAIDPLSGVFAGLIFSTCAAWWFGWRGWCMEIAGAAGLSIIVFTCCFCWYPYPFADWWIGTCQMAGYALMRGERLNGPRYLVGLFSSGFSWFSLGMIVLAGWSGLRSLRRKRFMGEGPAFPMGFYAMLVVLGVALRRFALYGPWALYNVIPFMPVAFLAVFFEMGRDQAPSAAAKPRVYQIMAFIVLTFASLTFSVDLCSRIQTMRFGLDLPEARRLFGAVRALHPGEVIALPESLFTLTEDYSDILFYRPGKSQAPARARIVVIAQEGASLAAPPAVHGFTLDANYFNSRRFPFPRDDRGSGFAVYSRAMP